MTIPFPIIWTGVTGVNEMMIVEFLGFWGIVGWVRVFVVEMKYFR